MRATLLIAGAAALTIRKKDPFLTDSIAIDGSEIFGGALGAGGAPINECRDFPRASTKGKRSLKVCGTRTKIHAWLRNRCKGFSNYETTVGTCDTKADSQTCTEISEADAPWLKEAASFMILPCDQQPFEGAGDSQDEEEREEALRAANPDEATSGADGNEANQVSAAAAAAENASAKKQADAAASAEADAEANDAAEDAMAKANESSSSDSSSTTSGGDSSDASSTGSSSGGDSSDASSTGSSSGGQDPPTGASPVGNANESTAENPELAKPTAAPTPAPTPPPPPPPPPPAEPSRREKIKDKLRRFVGKVRKWR